MEKPIPIGVEFYKEMVNKGYYYVDKTLMVREILDAGASVSLFTRPRRFGKTLAVSMLKTFFEDERDGNGGKIDNSRYFEGKKISDCGREYLEKQGKYPVISLTLKSVKQPSFGMAYHILRNNIAEEFRRHQYVLRGGTLDGAEERKFRDILGETGEAADYATSLAFLSQCLEKYHHSRAIILIDEYDVPLENAYFRGFYDQMADFIRSLLESALKTNGALEFAVITGCLRISKESIFTGLNNLKVLSILRDDFGQTFGFTEAEVRAMLAAYGLESRMEEVKRWYDGYLFGRVEVYNPWSIINYVDENRHKKEFFPKPYWSNTSSNSIIRELIEGADTDTRTEIEQLVAGGSIEKPVHEDITYGDIYESKDNLWNFLFFTGYLRKVGERFETDRVFLRLAIPNVEIRCIYEDTILSWFEKKVRAQDRTPLYQALLAGDHNVVEKELNGQMRKTISFYDAAEQFYHGFMVGMLGGLGEYHLRSNRETGDGRADIVMIPEDWQKPVLIFELKKADNFTLMEAGCGAALAQIEEMRYDAGFKEEGYVRFIKYGICFCKKACQVRAVVENLGEV